MKNPPRNIISVQDKSGISEFPMNQPFSGKITVPPSLKRFFSLIARVLSLSNLSFQFEKIKTLGITPSLEDYERRKLKIFNLLNFFQFIFGLAIPISAAISKHPISTLGWVAACMPALVSVLVLFLNSRRNYEVSTL